MTDLPPIPAEAVEAAAKAICNCEADPGEAWDDFLPESDVRRTCRAEAQTAVLAFLDAMEVTMERRPSIDECVQLRTCWFPIKGPVDG